MIDKEKLKNAIIALNEHWLSLIESQLDHELSLIEFDESKDRLFNH